MAKIQEVDYKAIPAKAKNMRAEGKALNKEMTNAYKNVQICIIHGMERGIMT